MRLIVENAWLFSLKCLVGDELCSRALPYISQVELGRDLLADNGGSDGMLGQSWLSV